MLFVQWLHAVEKALPISFFTLSFFFASQSHAQLRGGAIKISLLPASVIDIPMTGYAREYEALSQGLHDSLFARIVVLEEESVIVAIASIDLIGFNVDRDPRSGRLASLLQSMEVDHWFIVSTHTHGGPRVLDLGKPYVADRNWPSEEPYVDWVEDQIVEGVGWALDSLEPVSAYMANGQIELGFNRRLVKENGRVEMIWGRGRDFPRSKLGPTDPEVGVVRFDRKDGTPLALLYTYSCHAVVLGATNRLLTADFPGYASSFIEGEMLGAPALFLQGAAGDIDPLIDVQSRFEPAQSQGEALGAEVVRVARGKMEMAQEYPILRWQTKNIDFKRFGDPKRTVSVRLSLMSLGSRWAMLGMPGEPFVELGLEFKRWAPLDFPYVVGYTNGYVGYFPTEKAHEEGGYGANYGDTMHLAAESGEEMISLGLEWVNKSQWSVPMPRVVSCGKQIQLKGRLGLEGKNEVDIEGVFFDASSLGGVDRHYLLSTADKEWVLDWHGQVEWPLGSVLIPFYTIDSQGSVEPLMREYLRVEPDGDWVVWDGTTKPWEVESHSRVEWTEEEEFQGAYQVARVQIASEHSRSLGAFWTMDWVAPVPVPTEEFSGLTFEFHPGTLSGEQFPIIVAVLGDKTINFLGEDLSKERKWQKVFIPQKELREVENIGKLRFWGRGQGTFYLRNIRWKYIPDQTYVAEDGDARSNYSSLSLEAGPNPFNGSTVLRYAIQKEGLYSMVIYNMLGQQVKAVFTSWLKSGRHERYWDGRDDENKQLSSGMYLVRLTSEHRDIEITTKLINLQ